MNNTDSTMAPMSIKKIYVARRQRHFQTWLYNVRIIIIIVIFK